MPRVLFVNSNINDYLADGVFHGVRTLLGPDAVDFPKAEYLYDTFPQHAREHLWGRGFTLYGLLPDIDVGPRHHLMDRALAGEFDLVVFGAIWPSFGLWSQWGPQLAQAGISVAVLDGDDRPRPYPYSWRWWRKRYWRFLPRAHNRARYFKREITSRTRWYASYLLLPPRYGRTLGLRPISLCIPSEKIVATPTPKEQEFASHVVDPELAGRLGANTAHVFSTEHDYYSDLKRSRFGVTTKRAGWDAMRHYEIAANGAVPCFRDLEAKPQTCSPFGLDDENCVSYRDADDLMRKVGALGEDDYDRLQAGALSWARSNTTVARARELLAACEIAV